MFPLMLVLVGIRVIVRPPQEAGRPFGRGPWYLSWIPYPGQHRDRYARFVGWVMIGAALALVLIAFT